MTELEVVFRNGLISSLTRISLRKFDRKNVDDTFIDIESIFKCVVNEKPLLGEANTDSGFEFYCYYEILY